MTDVFWNWAGWHVIKWIFGALLLGALLFVIWKLNTQVNAVQLAHEEMIRGIEKILYDTRLNDANTIRAITEFIEGRR